MRTIQVTRRAFLQTTVAVPLAAAVVRAQPATDRYSVLYVGDVHFDRLSHHDMSWLTREKPNDIRQVQNYSRLTAEVWPQTLARLRARIAAGRTSSSPPVAFVAQIGDLIEGLCGTPALAELQAEEALASIRDAKLGAPVLFCKGNHDITGPGAKETFDRVLLPFVRSGMSAIGSAAKCFDVDGSSLALAHGPDWFLFFDAYDHPRSLAWLERVLAKRTARHVFILVHPPVVPYGARSTWIVYAKPAERAERQRLLNVLGEHRVFALTGHIHKYAAITRQTDRGRFVELALSSVISSPRIAPAGLLTGIDAYTPDQVRVEPSFSPDTESERRAMLAAEAPQVRAFQYGDVPGYASIVVDGSQVRAELYPGLATEPWRTLDLVAMRDSAIVA